MPRVLSVVKFVWISLMLGIGLCAVRQFYIMKRSKLLRERGYAIPPLSVQLFTTNYTNRRTTMNYKGHTLLIEQSPITGAIHISAIPNTGATIRRTFYFFTKAQAVRAMKGVINESL